MYMYMYMYMYIYLEFRGLGETRKGVDSGLRQQPEGLLHVPATVGQNGGTNLGFTKVPRNVFRGSM